MAYKMAALNISGGRSLEFSTTISMLAKGLYTPNLLLSRSVYSNIENLNLWARILYIIYQPKRRNINE